jgi:ribose/xylose/arabinose/galactoside ABC-type transport system permease subunit
MTVPSRLKVRGQNNFFTRLLLSEYFVLVLSVFYFLIITAIVPSMTSVNNLKNIFSNMWPLFAIAVGQTFVLLLGGIDLSQTSVMAVTSVIGAAFMCTSANPAVLGKSPIWGWFLTENGGPLAAVPALASTLIGIAIMLAIGTLIGFINGNLIARLNMPPFMVTLIAQMFYSALAIYITKSQNIMFLPETFENLGSDGIGFFPYSFFVAIFLASAAQLLLSLTILGRFIYSTGGNVRAARVSGVPVARTTVFVYSFSGFCAAIGSVLYSGRLMQGRPTMGSAMLLDIMAATIIGGTSTFGGKGKVSWTLYGVLFYTILATSLQQLKLDNFTINIVKGFVRLAAATLDAVRSGIRRSKASVSPAPARKKAQEHG